MLNPCKSTLGALHLQRGEAARSATANERRATRTIPGVHDGAEAELTCGTALRSPVFRNSYRSARPETQGRARPAFWAQWAWNSWIRGSKSLKPENHPWLEGSTHPVHPRFSRSDARLPSVKGKAVRQRGGHSAASPRQRLNSLEVPWRNRSGYSPERPEGSY